MGSYDRTSLEERSVMKKDIQVFLDATTTTDKKLISVACVAEDGQEFYAEISDTYQIADCRDFICEHVLPRFRGCNASMTEAQFAARLKDWINQLSLHDKKVDKRVILNVYGRALIFKNHWDIRKFFDNFGGSPKGLKHLHELIYPDNHRTRLFSKEWTDARIKLEILNLPYTLESARGLLAAWKKVETCKETKEIFDASEENCSVVRSVTHKKNDAFGVGFCKLCGNLTEEYAEATNFFIVGSTKQEEVLFNSTEIIKQEAIEILEKLICAKDNAKLFGALITSHLISENQGDFDYDLLYSPGITEPEVQKPLMNQIKLNLQREEYRKQCEENNPTWQYIIKRVAKFESNTEIRSKKCNENKQILTSEQQALLRRDAIAHMKAYIKRANSSSKNKEQNKEGKLLPGRKSFFSENTNSLKRSPKKMSAAFCSDHNPWGTKESRRNYKNDCRRLNEFNKEFERLVLQKIENKICNVYLKKLFDDEYKDWKSLIIDKFDPEKSYRYERHYCHSEDSYDYIGEVFGLKKLRKQAYINVTKSTLEKIEELQKKGILNQSEIARRLGLTRKAISMALSRKKQKTQESV